MTEINAWDATMSTEWEKLCALKVMPNWKDLGKRLGKQMKEVAKAVSELTHAQIVDFMNTGLMTVCGFELTKDDVVVKREFSGDAKVYEACVSDDGSLMIAIDTTCDEEVLQELRARTLAATVQKLRKSAGLVVSDRVEIFYEEQGAPNGTATGPIAAALLKHASSTVKRIKMLPLPMELRSKNASTIISEEVKDAEISKSPVTFVLTQPVVAVDLEAVAELIKSSSSDAQLAPEMVAMYLQSMDYDRALSTEVKYTLL